jgi:hypothetical protein
LICLPSLPLSAAVAIFGTAIRSLAASDTTEPVNVGVQELPHVGHFDGTFSGP